MKKIMYVLIQAENGIVGPAATYQTVTVFDSYDEAWAVLLELFNDFGGSGEINETFGNAFVDDGRIVWQIIADVME